MNKIKLFDGFSLIELMIVISIISILSLIAIPSYQNYTRRARFIEVITATVPFKIAVTLALQEGIPQEELMSGAHGIPSAPPESKHLASLKVENGIITATSTEVAGHADIILIPNKDGSTWHIDGSCLKEGLCSG